uniref:LtxB n=1 Tax=Lyngbya majuscula TaxID=158786 RepID=Q5V8A7_9CYAN|nr:LtxB [Lyngbya majuscula]
MTNPFADPSRDYWVLCNAEGQYSLWPTSLEIPEGWQTAFGPESWQNCLDNVEKNWTDMRPLSLLGQRKCPVPYPFREYVALNMDPIYASLQQRDEMLRISVPYGDDAWLASSYKHVKCVIQDTRFSRETTKYDEARLTPIPIRTSVLGMDPPDHTRLREALAAALTPSHVEQMKPWITSMTEQLIDDFVAQGPPADLVEQFALPFTGHITCELMGIPLEDRPQFKAWCDGFSSTSSLTKEEVEVRMQAMYTYITELVGRRRESPSDDIISKLLQPEDKRLELSEIELIDLATILLLAGYDSTAMELANAIFVLLTHPEQTQLIREQPKLMPQAVQELLRYIPIDAHVTFARYATEDVQVGNTLVRTGDAILASFPSANHDPAIFEDPHTFNIMRPRKPNFGLGTGIHSCAGKLLAVVELEIALSVLIRRLPTLRLAIPAEEVPWQPGSLLRSTSKLPAEW